MNALASRAAVFLDRDGTLIRDVGYLFKKEQIEILPRVPDAIQVLRRQGYKIVVVTNQSGVARGRLSEDELKEIHQELCRQLARAGATPDAIYYCPHHPEEGVGVYKTLCDCRKPNIGLIRKAVDEFGVDPTKSYVVGDQPTDMELAARAGAMGIWIRHGTTEPPACGAVNSPVVVEDLWQAANWISARSEHLRTEETR